MSTQRSLVVAARTRDVPEQDGAADSETRRGSTDMKKGMLMRTTPLKGAFVVAGVAALALAGCTPDDSATSGESGTASGDANTYSTREVTDGVTTFTVVDNPNNGTKLSFGSEGAFALLEEKDGDFTYAFKDMNGNGKLDTWEDWRQPYADRAADLAPQLAADQISGLMLFSSHERAAADGLTDAQKEYLSQSYLRNVLFAGDSTVEPDVQWTNQMQAYVETLAADGEPYIPVNFSSDPRHDASNGYDAAAGSVSQWPSFLGMAATFDPDIVLEFGQYASEEYRALGLANALSPQMDLASDPRWPRITGTFGEDPDMSAEMAANYVTGFQETYGEDGSDQGWGQGSVSTVIKHFPGDGAAEGGRESHTQSGKYAVMPGDNGAAHLKSFEAAMAAGAGGMMTSYSIVTDGEGKAYYGNLMGSAYDKARVDIARVDNDYDGVIVTDWGVTNSVEDGSDAMIGTGWGAKDLSVEQRHFEILKAGVDQFGGNNDIEPVRAAYKLWEDAYEAGDLEESAADRWADTGRRVLTNLFSVGLYDNPYQDLEESTAIVGNEEAVSAGLEAQQKSVVMVKDDGAVSCPAEAPDYSTMTAYIPRSYDTGRAGLFGPAEVTEKMTVDEEVAKQYFANVVTDEAVTDADGNVTSYTAPDLSDVDVVVVGMDNPNNGGVFTNQGMTQNEDGTRSWWPVSLQYRPYTADGANVRQTSIAGDILADGSKENRSYYGATSQISNEANLDAFERAVKAVQDSGKDIPVLTLMRITNAMVIPAEFEADSDAILLGFGVSDSTLLEAALGINETSGRLPIGMPASMDAVEGSKEDVEKDIESYKDSSGNVYEYGFGLTCEGTPVQ